MRTTTASTGLDQEGRDIVERLGGRWTDRGGLCRCPAHDDRSPSLSVRVGRTRLLFHCFAGCEAEAVLKALRAAGHRPGYQPRGLDGAQPSLSRSARGDLYSRSALRIWNEARPLAGSPAQRYLAARGIDTASPELRYHPKTPHGPHPATVYRPALIAAVRDDSGLVAVHRTFLDARRCRMAEVDDPRCGLGPFGGGAVRLGGAAAKLGLAEGIETALSASILFTIPCWAALGTERFRLVAFPPEVKEIVLFLDHDAGGRRAEALARDAFPPLRISCRHPGQIGADWNDVLKAERRRRKDR
jgi:hypothetical protein